MASTRASAGASAANAPSRRQPTPRSAPATPAPKKRWSPKEEAQLTKMYKSKGPVWAELAQRLGTGRTIKQVEAKVTALGLRQREKRAAGGPTWHAQGRRLGDKNKKRKEAAKAALTLASPAGVPPSEPRPKRPAAVAADAAMLAELEATTSRDAEVRTCTARSARSNPAGRCMPTRRRPRRRRWACVRQPSLSGRGSKLLLLMLLLCCCGAAGHGNFGTLLEALGGDSSQINAVRVFLYRTNRLGAV